MSTTILKQELGKHGWCSILCQVRQWHIKKKIHYIISVHKIVVRFPDRDRKTTIKGINSTNHSMIKQCDEPITVPSNYLQIHLSSRKKSLKHPGLNGGSNPHLCDAGSAEKTDDHTDWNECLIIGLFQRCRDRRSQSSNPRSAPNFSGLSRCW